MKKIRNIIIFLILLLIVVAIILFNLLSKKDNINPQESNTLDSADVIVNNFEKEANINTFFTKENTINMFLSYIYNQESNVPREKILYSLLNEDYKSQNRYNRRNGVK